MELVPYVALKLAAYIVWCGIGVGLFRPDSPAKLRQAFGFGLTTVIVGAAMGIGLSYLVTSGSLNAEISGLSHREIYFRIYLPVRWLEWAIIGYLMQQSAMSFLLGPSLLYSTGPASFFRTPSSRFPGMLWKLGGVAISFAADLQWILGAGGIENMPAVGKFLC
ncbi:MAG TPA: hypothetical protein VNW97_17180 [Candidatus Saccharimonadales bacterium]|jgi:hypothetical protein|nr:hypothetical protein [Candidatus Saccharimonadales bacterium]